MTLRDRVNAFQQTFAKWPASWPWVTKERGRDVLYGVWVIGADYRNRAKFYGAYPKGYLARVMALFPELQLTELPGWAESPVLHVFSGSLEYGSYVRLDVNPANKPDVVGSAYDVATLFGDRRFDLILADPPYSTLDAREYGTPAINRHRATAALAAIAKPGAHLAWLDTCWPMHSKTQWVTVGRILVQRSTNHRARVLSIFERTAA